jgi:hypothetical protein
MEAAPVAAPDLIVVSDDEEDPEEVNPEEWEPTDQPNQEEQAPGEDLDDHHGLEVEEVQEQDEAAEEVIWDVLTPKIGTGKRLTCGPSLVRKHHSAGNFPQRIR